jgi:hypothetical protein
VLLLALTPIVAGAQDSNDDPPPEVTAATLERPPWAAVGVPDTVWILAEAHAAAEDKDDAKAILRDAEALAREALEGYESDVGRRFALAVILGMRANIEGGRTKVRAASEMNVQLDSILELDPEHARARHLLGRLHAGVRRMNRITRWIATNLLGGDELKKATWEEAERNLAFAEAQIPEVAEHHLQLANLYRDTDRRDLALVEVEHVLALPATTPMEIATREEATELKEKLGG